MGQGTSSLRRASNVQNETERFRDFQNRARVLSIGIRQSDLGTGELGLGRFGAVWRGLVWRGWRELAASRLQCDLAAVG